MTMRSSRKIIAEFIGVFLIGAMVGGLIVWCVTDTQLTSFMTRTNNPDVLVARIEKKYSEEYHLSPAEMEKIKPLVHEMAQHIYSVRHNFAVDVLSTMNDYHKQIAAQLTPEHRDAYLKATDDRRSKLSTLLMPDQGSPSTPQKQ